VTKINKKQVIYYSGQAFCGANHRVELLKNNEAYIHDVEDERYNDDYKDPFFKEKKHFLQLKDIDFFWETMDKLEVYQWSKNYVDSRYCDGYGYEIKLRNPEGKAKYCSGHMNYPENILDFIIALNKLFKTNIKVYPE
tara:strand:- start:852 stop:1265 length:414 start_codon:yes stop_codon:yes gene_type:complete